MPFSNLTELLTLALRGLLDPLLGFSDPQKRTSLPFLLGAALLGALVWRSRGARRGSLLGYLFPRRVWLHRSALLDYRLLFARAVLRFTVLAPLAFSELAVAAALASALSSRVAAPGAPALADRTAVAVLYALCAFVLEDLARYTVHRLAHRVPALWELHKVHHSAEVMTPLTVGRAHPLESVIMRAGAQLAVGTVTGLFLWLFPGRLAPLEIFGVHALSVVWAFLGANLRHSHVWLSYGPAIEHVFISPAQHQIHHGDRPDQYDRNFGSALAIWDWAFGSLRVTTAARPPLRFGLPKGERNHGGTVTSMLLDPLVLSARALGRSASPAAVLLALGALGASAVPGCVRVSVSYRDVGTDAPDAETPDAARPDAPLDAPPLDAPRADAPLLDVLLADTPLGVGPDATRAVLRAVGERVVLVSLRDFEAAALALEAAASAARASGSPEARTAARAAWRAAMRVWQRVEALQLGPAGLSIHTAGGRGLRDEIYAWPLVSRCRMDEATVAATHADAALLGAAPVSARGLSAVEYLLFHEGADNGCAATAAINATGTWAALGEAEIARRRLVYAATAAALVVARASELRRAWEPSGGDFVGALGTAGAGSAVYATAPLGLNALSDALFYVDHEVADLKLGVPAGLHVDCPTSTCPERVESPWADGSLDHVRANLEAFRDAYLGAPVGEEAPGLDDLLRSIGAGDLDARAQASLARALGALDPVTVPLEAAVVTDAADVAVLHAEMRALGDLLELEILGLLGLALPSRLEGDND